MTRVLVVGGTNFVGPEVVRRLQVAGAEVIALHRGKTEDDLGEAGHIHDDRANVAAHAIDVRPDVILDMAPVHARDAAGVVAAAEAAGASRVVAVSSMDVYRAFDVVNGRDDELQAVPFTEDTGLRRSRYPHRDRFGPDDPMYDYDKLDVEERVMGVAGIPGVVLRLPVVFGPKDRQRRLFSLVRRMADGMPVIVMADSLAGWRFMKSYRDDVADAIVLGCLHSTAAGRIYNVGSFDGTEADWARRVGRAVGWSGEVVVIPAESAPDELRPEGNFAQHLVGDTSRIRRELGWEESADLDTAIAITAEWELANPPPEFAYDRDVELAAAGR